MCYKQIGFCHFHFLKWSIAQVSSAQLYCFIYSPLNLGFLVSRYERKSHRILSGSIRQYGVSCWSTLSAPTSFSVFFRSNISWRIYARFLASFVPPGKSIAHICLAVIPAPLRSISTARINLVFVLLNDIFFVLLRRYFQRYFRSCRGHGLPCSRQAVAPHRWAKSNRLFFVAW